MAIKSRTILKNTFIDGYIPTGNDFSDVFDSYVHQQDNQFNSILIDSSGNIGLGCPGPFTHRLEVCGDELIKGADFVTNGEGAALSLGDDNHYIKAKYGKGLFIGTYNFATQEGADVIHVQQDTLRVGIGTNTPAKKLHVAGDVQVDGTICANDIMINGMGMIPTGGIIMWSGSTAPAGWGLCDGGTYPRTDGSGNIITPDLKGRFIVGYNSGFNDYNNPGDLSPMSSGSGGSTSGKVGGLDSVKLTAQQSGLPSHNHNHNLSIPNSGGHNHIIRANDESTGGSDSNSVRRTLGNNNKSDYEDYNTYTQGDHTHPISGGITNNNSQDAVQSHENRPPYYVLAFIIKL